MEREDDRFIGGKQRVEVGIRQSMWMRAHGLELEQIDHIDEAYLQIRELLAQDCRRRKSFCCDDVARAGYHHVRLATLVIAGPSPNADSFLTMSNLSLIHISEPTRQAEIS